MARLQVTPVDTMTEIMAGVVMALTSSVSLYVASSRTIQPHGLVEGVLGCNVAWAIFDGLLYVFAQRSSRRRKSTLIDSLRLAPDLPALERRLREIVGDTFERVAPHFDLEGFRRTLHAEDVAPSAPSASFAEDVAGAIVIGLAEILPVVPVVVPLLTMSDPHEAIRVSSAICLVLLSASGVTVARWSGQPIWLLGVMAPILGAILVGICLLLGG